MAVDQDPKGTMLKALGIDTPSEPEGKTPEGNTEVSPNPEEEKVYTQKQLDQFIQAAKSEQGRVIKEAKDEAARLQSELTRATSEVSLVQKERDEIHQRLEELSADDPEKKVLVKLDKELREQQRKIRAEQSTLEVERKSLQEQLAKGEEGMRKYHIFNIANEYEGSDTAKLTSLCDTLGISGEEQIRTIAESFGWTKKTTDAPGPSLHTPSGHTQGGSQGLREKDIRGMSAEDIIKHSAELAKMPLTL